MGFKNKNLHLIVSSLIIIPIGLTYGLSPKAILIKFFELKVATTNIENVFRAMMGIYFWCNLGLDYWYSQNQILDSSNIN